MSTEDKRAAVHVVAAAIVDAAGRVLIAQRPPGKHLAGGWEFPGGKLEPGETRDDGLARELAEELGITLIAAHPLIRLRHFYGDRDVDLDVWKVTAYEGIPLGCEGQPVRWCPRDDLHTAALIPADQPIVTTLVLPERITSAEGKNYSVGSPYGSGRLVGKMCACPKQAAAAAAAGADFLLATTALDALGIKALTANLSVPVYVRDIPLEVAYLCGASGLHTL